jgi:hypothetical protein
MDPKDRHFVLGGVAVFERKTYFLSEEIEFVQRKHFPTSPPVMFQASAIRNGRGFWRNVEEAKRQEVLDDLVKAVADAKDPGVVLYGAAVEKSNLLHGEEAVEHATAEICGRFDIFLMRRHQEHNDSQRGLLIFAEGRYDKRARIWVHGFRQMGTKWGVLRNLADIPYFANASESRLLQVADLVAHAVFILYEQRDPSLIRGLLSRFDQKDGTLHGLVHYRQAGSPPCSCPACASRAKPGDFGTWF